MPRWCGTNIYMYRLADVGKVEGGGQTGDDCPADIHWRYNSAQGPACSCTHTHTPAVAVGKPCGRLLQGGVLIHVILHVVRCVHRQPGLANSVGLLVRVRQNGRGPIPFRSSAAAAAWFSRRVRTYTINHSKLFLAPPPRIRGCGWGVPSIHWLYLYGQCAKLHQCAGPKPWFVSMLSGRPPAPSRTNWRLANGGIDHRR